MHANIYTACLAIGGARRLLKYIYSDLDALDYTMKCDLFRVHCQLFITNNTSSFLSEYLSRENCNNGTSYTTCMVFLA